MSSEVFGLMPDGLPVKRYTLKGGGLTAHFLTYGAVLQDLRLEGHGAPLVLGFEALSTIISSIPRASASPPGRYANRIRDGHLELDGRDLPARHQFPRAPPAAWRRGGHRQAGLGAGGSRRRQHRAEDPLQPMARWAFPAISTSPSASPCARAACSISRWRRQTDAPTLCNLAHHSYFNLGGADVADHLLQIDADAPILPVGEELIPTGEQAPVEGTRFDFREPPPTIGPRSAEGLIDHNFCLSPDACCLAAGAPASPAPPPASRWCSTPPNRACRSLTARF